MEQHGLFLNDSESLMQNNPTTRKLNFSPTSILSLNNEAQRTVIANGNVSLTFPFIQFIQIFISVMTIKGNLVYTEDLE